MCALPEGRSIPARDYFDEAKRRNKHLKKLRSVSRAYRKTEIRSLKERAAAHKFAEEQMREMEQERRSNLQKDVNAAGRMNYHDYTREYNSLSMVTNRLFGW